MNSVRFGVIGLGNIGRCHADYLLEDKVSRATLAAVASASPQKRRHYQQRGALAFASGESLLAAGTVDAVIIATPHFQHPAFGIGALEAGIHALIEKPIAAHKADAEALLVASRCRPNLLLGCMFQMRAEPRFQKMRELIRQGALGEIVRVNWINTDWYRTEAYYRSSDWRATWRGEGGGVLLNQCLHNLDALQWLCGQPARVRGFCQFGRFHDIEVEDNVTAYLEWADGATGVFVSSTGEAPGTNRLEIAGTKGRLALENDRLTLTRNETDMREFSRTATEGFVKPASHTEAIPFEKAAAPHAAITQNFVNAILDGVPLLAPGADGMHSLELANAITLSSLENQTVELPMSGARWAQKLNSLIAAAPQRRD